jgi:hypothetical protein
VSRGARQLHRVFDRVSLDRETFNGRGHVRLKQLQHLIATGQLDAELYWNDPAGA